MPPLILTPGQTDRNSCLRDAYDAIQISLMAGGWPGYSGGNPPGRNLGILLDPHRPDNTRQPAHFSGKRNFVSVPNGKHLAYQTLTPTGSGNLHIMSVDTEQPRFTLPPEYDVLTLIGLANNLMVQAQTEGQTVLLTLTHPLGLFSMSGCGN